MKSFLIIFALILAITAGIYYSYEHNASTKTIELQSRQIMVGPNTKETEQISGALGELKNATNIETCKKYAGNGDFSCVTNLAIKNKDPKICSYYADTGEYARIKNWCLAIYIDKTKDKNACSLMSSDPEGEWWKNETCGQE